MAATPRVKEALERLRAVFREPAGVELTVTDAAGLAGLDDQVCDGLLRVLRDAGVIQQRRSGAFRGSPVLNVGAVPPKPRRVVRNAD